MLRLLLDENLPKKLKFRFGAGYEVMTVPEMGWSSLKDSELLDVMVREHIDYLITADKRLVHQQRVEKWAARLVALDTPDNCYETLLPLVESIKQSLSAEKPENYIWLKG